uniref:C-type lectin domain-containing protein n=1 Tax=Latimeria chalumnae TaxID=7897 RepID=H3A3R7_LATCH
LPTTFIFFTDCSKVGCQKDWVEFQRSCYLFSSSKLDWTTSESNCVSMGSHLVVINSADEQNFIVRNRKEFFWIGLSDIIVEGQWSWVDGSPYNLLFWSPGEPNDAPQGEDCAMLDYQKATGSLTATWNDAPCSRQFKWICE